MDINNIQGFNQRTSQVPIDNTQLRNQNREAAETDLTQENTRTAQKAFEVNITSQAQDRLAAQELEKTEDTRTTAANTEQTPAPAFEASKIVNIVA